jgi:thiol-disulfide isomerase/thioredoxin
MKAKSLLVIVFIFLVAFSNASKSGHDIRIKIEGAEDSLLMLASYFGSKTVIIDTTFLDKKGYYRFAGDEDLDRGIYIIASEKKSKYFEFIVNDEQKITFETNKENIVEDMSIKGSTENRLFFDYLVYNTKKYKEMEALQEDLSRVKGDEDSTKLVKEEMQTINDEVEEYKLKFIEEHPTTFMASFFKAMQEVEIPDPPILENGKEDSTFAFRYYKAHYWDNIDVADDRLLRTPLFHSKLDRYISKVLIQDTDSITKEIDALIEKASSNEVMFKYLVQYITYEYETSTVMGFDAVFVHMAETYYMTDRAYWVNPTVKENIEKRAKKLKPILIGKPAPNLIMLDTSMKAVSMHHIKANYTILLFWDTHCGHCKTETPKMVKFYNENKDKYGLAVYAICSDTSMSDMKAYIKQKKMNWINVNGPRAYTEDYHELYDIYSTPVIYLLDENKKIIAKRLTTEQLSDFIRRYEKMMAEKGEEEEVGSRQ